ncbi:MAG: TerC family protein [Elusimicrobiaceae bacterium]|nr:TerC family protein [Elusimicrobiaceae bacterium]
MHHLSLWILFWVVVITALGLDLFILNKHHGHVSIKDASVMVAAWVTLAFCFGGVIWFASGAQSALEFFTGYVIEYSLSIDNMFVFIMIFTYFAVPKDHQPKVLLWGILGAVIMRFILIFIGVQLITRFTFMIYIFGAILIYTAIKMLVGKDEQIDPSKNLVLKLLKKIIPINEKVHNGDFFCRENGKLFATTLLATVVVIEASDLVFAVDSIPAVLAVTQDTFIVYTSNIFAIIGLRSLYFLLSGMAGKFEYLKYGIAAVLAFVGVKMLISHYYKMPTVISLLTIVLILSIAISASVIKNKKLN